MASLLWVARTVEALPICEYATVSCMATLLSENGDDMYHTRMASPVWVRR